MRLVISGRLNLYFSRLVLMLLVIVFISVNRCSSPLSWNI